MCDCMKEKEMKIAEKLGGERYIDQIVLATDDMGDILDRFDRYFGYSGWELAEDEAGSYAKVILSNGIELCIAEPGGADSVYRRSLDSYGRGIVGIRERISEKTASVWRKHIAEKNLTVLETADGGRWLDLREEIGGMYGLHICEDPVTGADYPKTIGQICIVADDVRRMAERMYALVGMGPWEIGRINNHTADYLESSEYDAGGFPKSQMLAGMAWYQNLEIELIEPTDGPMPYFKYLNRHGNGFHHIKETVKKGQWESTLAHCCREEQISVALAGKIGPCRFCNLDTETEFGFVYELGDGREMDRLPEGYDPYLYPEPGV